MRVIRFIWFFFMIAIGVGAGLYYTWVVDPVEFVDATFNQLRQDYKADYVLMTAEIYNEDEDLFQAMMRLDRLAEVSAESALSNAIQNAEQLGYQETDLDLMYQLDAVVNRSETAEKPTETMIIPTLEPTAGEAIFNAEPFSETIDNPFAEPFAAPTATNAAESPEYFQLQDDNNG